MATENELILRLRTEGVSTVKELKEAIKECRDQLVRLDNTSEDYKETVDELVKYETKLTEVMKAGKQEVSAATGSYNALVNEMSSLKKAWRAVTDEAERARLGRRIGEINAQLKEMDASIGNYQRNVGDYENAFKKALLTPQQELRNLRKELAQLEVGTAEYNRAFVRMTELTTQLRKQQELLRYSSADLGDIFSNLAGVSASVVGGFSAINAAMALMGDESDDIQRAMLQAQRMIQLVQGLSSLQNLGPKISGLFNGIRNFITGFQGGAAAVAEFNKETEKAAGTTEQVSKELTAEAASLNTNAAATTELANAKRTLNEQDMQALENYQMLIRRSQNRIAQLNDELKHIQDNIAAGHEYHYNIDYVIESHKKEIKALQGTIDMAKQRAESITQEAGAVRGLAAAEKTLEKEENRAMVTTVKTNNVLKLLKQNFLGAGVASKSAAGGLVVYTAASTAAKVASQALGVALKALGIGLVISALTALLGLLGKGVKHLWGWATGAKAAADATDAIKRSTEELNKTLESNNENMDFQSRLMEAQGATYQQIYEYKKQEITANINLAKSQLAESLALEANTKKTWFNKKAREELTAAINEQRKSLEDLEKEYKRNEQEYEIDKARAANSGHTGGGGVNSQLKEAQRLYKQLQDLYKTDRQKLAETYEENKKIINKYIKDKKQKNEALILLEKKYYEDLRKLAKENMDAIYGIYLSQEQRRLALLNVWGDKYLQEAKKVLDEELEVNKRAAAKKVGFEQKSDAEIAKMDAATKKEYLERQKLYNNELYLLEKEYNQKYDKLVADHNIRQIEEGRRAIEVKKELAKSDEEVLNIEIELAEYDLATVYQKEGESSNEYRLRVIALTKALDEFKKKREEIKNNNDEQLRRDNDATEAKILNGQDSMQYYDKAIEAAQYYYDNLKKLQTESNEEFRQRQLEALDNLVQLQKSKQEQLRHNWENLANGIGDIFSSLADIYQTDIQAQKDANGQYNAESRRKFEWVKRLQIAQATISTISGAIEAFMGCQSLGQPWGAIIGAVQAAAVTAAGMAQIAQIKKTKLDGNSSTAEGTRYAVATPSITDYVPEGTVNLTGGAETENLANALSKTPIKAYVVESEVTAAQEVANQRNRETTF